MSFSNENHSQSQTQSQAYQPQYEQKPQSQKFSYPEAHNKRKIFKPFAGEMIGRINFPVVLCNDYKKKIKSNLYDDKKKKAFLYFLGAFPENISLNFFDDDEITKIMAFYENNNLSSSQVKQLISSKNKMLSLNQSKSKSKSQHRYQYKYKYQYQYQPQSQKFSYPKAYNKRKPLEGSAGEMIGKINLPAVLCNDYKKKIKSFKYDDKQKKAFLYFLGAFPENISLNFFDEDEITKIMTFYRNNNLSSSQITQLVGSGGSKKRKQVHKKKSKKTKKH